MKIGKLTFLFRVVRKIDPFLAIGYEYSKIFLARITFWIGEMKLHIVASIKRGFAFAISWTKHRIDAVHDRLNGKGKIKERGSVSFFLKSISDHKEAMRKENVD